MRVNGGVGVSNKAKIREDAMSLNPIDDALFIKMAEDVGFCQEILRVILEDKNYPFLVIPLSLLSKIFKADPAP